MSTEADFRLLQAAAKAAGIAVRKSGGMLFVDVSRPNGVVTGREWNPLTDSADALNLAVRLRMSLDLGSDDMSNAFVPGGAQGYACDHGTDPMAATRRAIVMAAAAIATGDTK